MESISLKYLDNKKENNLLYQIEDLSYLKITWTMPNASYVQENEVIGKVSYIKPKYRGGFNILAPCDGFLYIEEELPYLDNNENGTIFWESTNPTFYKKELQGIARVFQSMQDLDFYYFKTDKAVLEVDPYTNSHKIRWDKLRGIFSEYGVIKLDYINNNAVLVFDSEEKLRKGDCISLRFDNDKILDYLIQNEPTKVYPCKNIDYYSYLYYFTLYKEDLELLLNYELESYRITYSNNRLPVKTIPNASLYLLSDDIYVTEEISIYAKCYLDAIKRLIPNYKIPQRSVTKSVTEYTFNWCYVYLMKDISNGYHKIGISNTPEYREKTLQSEKPTIEMLACKKFPTRKIAEAIESALHTTYSQQRLRGEWFNLNEADVAAIIETLK
ncbi:MAG: GIY-YIG nuclease family protein [bacterium]